MNLSEDEVRELAKRMNGHFKKHGTTKDEIIRSFFILQDIRNRKESLQQKFLAPDLGFKQKGISLYKSEIVKLYNQGLSAGKIYDALKYKKEKPSLSTIKRYLKSYREWRRENG